MSTWLVKAEITVEADNRRDAWVQARKILEPLNGVPISIPQEPEKE